MGFDRRGADDQALGDLLVREPLRDQGQDLAFAVREERLDCAGRSRGGASSTADATQEFGKEARRDGGAAIGGDPQGAQEFVA